MDKQFLGGTSLQDVEAVSGSGDPVLIATTAQAFYESIMYVQLFTEDPTNPQGLSDEFFVEAGAVGADLNNNGHQNDSMGGHIINPSSMNLSYEDNKGNELQVPQVFTGLGLNDYLAINNPDNDLDLYYRSGDSETFTPPTISGYSSPLAYNATFALGENQYTFVYTSQGSGAGSGSSEANLAETGEARLKIAIIAGGLVLLGASLLVGRKLLTRRK